MLLIDCKDQSECAAMDSTTSNRQTIEKLKASGTATIANVLLGRGFRNVYLLGLTALDSNQERLAGPAFTLRFIPAREDLDSMENYASEENVHRRAVEECPAGSVLVIDSGGCVKASSAGDIMATRLKSRGAAGIVTDGGFRDTAGIVATGLSAYHQAPAPPATVIALHPVELNEPIGCAGVAIYPGDMIVGDSEGVVAIPSHIVDEIADGAYDQTQYEEYVELQVVRGRSIFGLFPATPESREKYEEWVAAGRPRD